jgi:hypothetical protein
MSRVLVISDTQAPFSHPDTIPFLKAVAKEYRTTQVVHIGDEADMCAISDWETDPDGMSAGDELKAAIVDLKKMYAVFPKVMACTSNHTARPFRKALKHGLPKAFLRDYKEFLQAPGGWEWRDYWIIDGVRYEHGEGYSGREGAYKAAIENGRSTVIGHIHSHAGIQYGANPEQLFFGMNVGSLIDNAAYAFNYNKKQKYKPIISCGVVIEGIPHLIPMRLDRNGRWTRKLKG